MTILIRIFFLYILLFTSLSSFSQNKFTQIVYDIIEFQPTTAEWAEALNLKLPKNTDSLKKIYGGDLFNNSGYVVGLLQVSRKDDEIINKHKFSGDTTVSQFDINTKNSKAFFYFKSKSGTGIDTVALEYSYKNKENEFCSYEYKYKITGNRMQIQGFNCEQVMITELIISKIDKSIREIKTNAWITDKIIPAIPVQSILMLHEDILPQYTIIEAVRSPVGPAPHIFKASVIN